MKILISSHAFAPSIGGIETVSGLLAAEFVKLGHEVTVVTQTPDRGAESLSYRVIRQPSGRELWRVIRWCDVFWHSNLSLRTIWPAFLLRKPVVITHHGSYCRPPRGVDLHSKDKTRHCRTYDERRSQSSRRSLFQNGFGDHSQSV